MEEKGETRMGVVTLPTLYKLSSTGKVQEWSICYGPDIVGSRYTIKHGQVGGKIQSTTTTIEYGKNVGKSNETSALQQAGLEANSLWKKQRDRKGYTEAIPKEKPFRPMLAQKFTEHADKIKYPALVQKKIDGIRCISYYDVNRKKVVYMSRQGKEFATLEHLTPILTPILEKGYILDGELYNHAMKANFQKLVSLIRRDKPVPDSSLIQYHVYDMVSEDNFEDRNTTLISLLTGLAPQIQIVETLPLKSKNEVDAFHALFVDDGYEGCIIRNREGSYEIDKRSYNLQKYKEFMDEEFELVSAEENKGKQAGQCSLICRTKEGNIFAVKPKGSDEFRSQIWDDFCDGVLMPGDKVSVRFFGYTNDGIPRHPIALAIRDYE